MPLNGSSSEDNGDDIDFKPGQVRKTAVIPITRDGRLKVKAPMFDPTVESSPSQIDDKRFKWWADEAAVSLKAAVENSFAQQDDDTSESMDNAAVSKNTKCICRQIAKQIPDLIYGDIVGALRGNLKLIENACQGAIWENRSPVNSKRSSDHTKVPHSNAKLDDILTNRVPHEINKYLTQKILAQLIGDIRDAGDSDDSDQNSDVSSVTGDYATAFPRISSDVRLNTWENSQVQEENTFMPTVKSLNSLAAAPTTQAPRHPGEVDRDHVHRKFYHDNSDAALQLDAFKKFSLVLVNGRGFRVVKHNHGGGRNTRILKYNPTKNRVHWGSNKVLGAEYLDCSAITRVKREESVVYVWHTTGRNKAKKMVGFETQREYDARVLELALLHLQHQIVPEQQS
jgi:hypothetical protein